VRRVAGEQSVCADGDAGRVAESAARRAGGLLARSASGEAVGDDSTGAGDQRERNGHERSNGVVEGWRIELPARRSARSDGRPGRVDRRKSDMQREPLDVQRRARRDAPYLRRLEARYSIAPAFQHSDSRTTTSTSTRTISLREQNQ